MAYRIVCSESKYGRLIKLPTSPLSTRTCSCFGNISQLPNPRIEDISEALSLNSPAPIHSLKKKNMCAPPDLLLHTTAGILNFLIFLSNATRSKGY